MPYIEDRGGLDCDEKGVWKGFPVAIVGRVLRICDDYRFLGNEGVIGPGTRFFPSREANGRPVASPFMGCLDLDSLDDVEIVIAIEEEFSITIPDADAQSIETVGQLIQYVKDRTG